MPIKEGTKANFTELTKSGVILVDFNADWCGPCQMLKPVVEELAESRPETFVSVNIDDEEELAAQFGVESIPCLVVLKDGKEVSRSVGVVPAKKIEKLLDKAVA